MIYLDNAATTFPKPECVYRDVEQCMREYCANPGRGGHEMSVKAGMAVTEARETVSGFFNIKNSMQVCFTKNATEALNIAIKGIHKRGGHIITTGMEHNSVMRPLRTLKRDMDAELTIAGGNELGEVEPDSIKKCIKANTELIVCTLSSNVNGIIMPVREIGRIAKNAGIPFLLDASQGAGSIGLDVEKDNIDMMAFPGHKGLLGPQGTGGLYVAGHIRLKSIMEGGTGSNSENMYQPGIMPDLLEAGTLNTPGIIGLCSGIRYILQNGIKKINEHKFMLVRRLIEEIRDIPGVRVYSIPEASRNSGIAAINIENLDSAELSHILDRGYGIATRAGLHCAPSAHNTLGTLGKGIVRFSVSCFNTPEEIDIVTGAIRIISKKYCLS